MPLRISVGVSIGDSVPSAPVPAPPAPPSTGGTGPTELDQSLLDDGLASLEANRGRVYYDAVVDAEAAAQYYAPSTKTCGASNC